MRRNKLKKPEFSPDFQDMIDCLIAEGAEFLIVGGYAMAVHGYIRATGALDVFVNPDHSNAERVYRALVRFEAPLKDISAEDFKVAGTIFQMGLPPFRIDIITMIEGVQFSDAFRESLRVGNEDTSVPFLSLKHLITSKLATGREKDALDVKEMKRLLLKNNE